MRSSPLSHVDGDALSTDPLTVFVRIGVLMSATASLLSAVFCSYAVSSKYVYSCRHRLQMLRVHAVSSSAKVIKLFSSRNSSLNHLVENTVSPSRTTSDLEKNVSFGARFSGPDPALRFNTRHSARRYHSSMQGVK